MTIPKTTIDWLIECGTPAVRYNARLLVECGNADKGELLSDPLVERGIAALRNWDGEIVMRHNSPELLMHRLALLADLGVKAIDPGLPAVVKTILKHRNRSGIPEVNIQIPKAFGGTDVPERTWLICDYPVVLYGLLKMGVSNAAVGKAVETLVSLADENGFRCRGAIPGFHGPGRKEDMCPIASVYAAKALSEDEKASKSAAARKTVDALLSHWEMRKKKKYFMFGIGTDFMKLKFPFVWYNLLHVLETVSRYPSFRRDPRVKEMAGVLLSKADSWLRFRPESAYLAYKGLDFADKKSRSPTITLMALRILKRLDLAS